MGAVRTVSERVRVPETLFEAAGLASPLSRSALLPVRRSGSGTDLRGAPVSFGVLGSSSSGNCSVLKVGVGKNYRLVLIDAGLSPLRTRRLLGELGLDAGRIAAVLLTHLHRDHYKETWGNKLPSDAWFWVHRKHRSAAKKAGVLYRRTEVFDDEPFDVLGLRVESRLAPHDGMGSAVFRIDVMSGTGSGEGVGVAGAERVCSLGYATDLGCVPSEAEELVRGVEVLAIESNYCDRMQLESGRHAFLIDRIMQDGGHLSNEQCAEACARLEPRRAVVLLHLSRQCNEPKRALAYHAGAGYEAWAAPEVGPMGLMALDAEGGSSVTSSGGAMAAGRAASA